MDIDIVTKEDLRQFRQELLEDFKKLLQKNDLEPKKWLRSSEVRKLLKISPGTLQNLRINGSLPFTKIGGLIYYSCKDIQNLLDENYIKNNV